MSLKNRFLATMFGIVMAATCTSSIAAADDAISNDLIDESTIGEIREWLRKPVVLISVEAQNSRHADLQQANIDDLDKTWRAQRKKQVQPLIAAVLSNPLSSYLTQIQARSGGLYTEIFIMDAKGLNVGQSAVTSDYWQGDEGKFKKTFPVGTDAVFVDEPELHEETNTWRAQVNLTAVNASNQAIGAITVEINLTELARRTDGWEDSR